MNRLIFLIIMISILGLTSCEKDNESNDSNKFLFKATVIGKGLDCGETFVISLTNIGSNSDIEDGMYYADQLDSEFKVSGLEIYLNCREPNDSEIYACTMMGPTYSHVIVTGVKKMID
ncbi:MAG: hypothetical protein ACOCWM_03180 [Cyclobacteriaceae bacterium]